MNTSVNLNEFSKDQLQWMLNRATMDIFEIDKWKESVQRWDLEVTMHDLWKQKNKEEKFLREIMVQVLNAMGDIAVRENIASN
jgi:hypothetical protein